MDKIEILNLNFKKKTAGNNYLSCYPSIIIKLVSYKAILSGFVNAMIDLQISVYLVMRASMDMFKTGAHKYI